MKSPFVLSAFFLTTSLCICAAPGAQARRASPAQKDNSVQTAGSVAEQATTAGAEAPIPGPLRSFLRMAGLSQKIAPEEVLPLLSRNIVVIGYPDFKNKADNPSEFLLLLRRYLAQARELQTLAGAEGVIRVPSCRDAQPLLGILGYRLRENCGPGTSVETSDADRG